MTNTRSINEDKIKNLIKPGLAAPNVSSLSDQAKKDFDEAINLLNQTSDNDYNKFWSMLSQTDQIRFIDLLVARTNSFLKEMTNNPSFINEVLKGYKKGLELNAKLNFSTHLFRNSTLQPLNESINYFFNTVLLSNDYGPLEWKIVFDVSMQNQDLKFFFREYFLNQCRHFLDLCKNENEQKIILNNIIKALHCLKHQVSKMNMNVSLDRYETMTKFNEIFNLLTQCVNKAQLKIDSDESKLIHSLIHEIDTKKTVIQELGLIFRCKDYLEHFKKFQEVSSLEQALLTYHQLLEINSNHANKILNINEYILPALFTCKELNEASRVSILGILKHFPTIVLLNVIRQLKAKECVQILKECILPSTPLGQTFKEGVLKKFNIEQTLKEFTPEIVAELLSDCEIFRGKPLYFELLLAIYKTHPSLLSNNPNLIDILFCDKTLNEDLKYRLHIFLDQLEKTTLTNIILNSPKRMAELVKQCSHPSSGLRKKDMVHILDVIFHHMTSDVLEKLTEVDICQSILLLTSNLNYNLLMDCTDSSTIIGNRLMEMTRRKIDETLKNIHSILYHPTLKGNLSLEELQGFQQTIDSIIPSIAAMFNIAIKRKSIGKDIPFEKQWWIVAHEKMETLAQEMSDQIKKVKETSIANKNEILTLLMEAPTSENWKMAFLIVGKVKDAAYFIENSKNFLTAYETDRNLNNLIKALYFLDQAEKKGINTNDQTYELVKTKFLLLLKDMLALPKESLTGMLTHLKNETINHPILLALNILLQKLPPDELAFELENSWSDPASLLGKNFWGDDLHLALLIFGYSTLENATESVHRYRNMLYQLSPEKIIDCIEKLSPLPKELEARLIMQLKNPMFNPLGERLVINAMNNPLETSTAKPFLEKMIGPIHVPSKINLGFIKKVPPWVPLWFFP